MSFHVRLRQAREERSLAIEEAAKLCGLSADDWELWESDADQPTVTAVVNISDGLDCDIEWLVSGKSFAPRLRKAREARMFTIGDAAQLCGVSLAEWRQWENNEDEPTYTPCVRIAEALSCDLVWLIMGDDAK